MMGKIEFTQYLLPDGRKTNVWIERPQAVVDRAQRIRAQGFRFEVEMLSDMETVSLTITDDEMDHAIEVVPNGPAVPEAVDRLINNFAVPTDDENGGSS